MLKSDFKVELGINRSELWPTPIKTENLSGGVGWNMNFLYTIHKGLFFGETGLGYRKMGFSIRENRGDTNKFIADASSINIPIVIGTNFSKKEHKILPIIKTGLHLDYTLGLNSERTEIFTKSDLQTFNLTYNISFGVKLNKIELLFSYNTDITNYIKTIDKNNKYLGLKISYNIFSK